MFSGSRLCLNNRIQEAQISLRETFHSQRLLFLYPRWFRTVVRKSQQPHHYLTGTTPTIDSDGDSLESTTSAGEGEGKSPNATMSPITHIGQTYRSTAPAPATNELCTAELPVIPPIRRVLFDHAPQRDGYKRPLSLKKKVIVPRANASNTLSTPYDPQDPVIRKYLSGLTRRVDAPPEEPAVQAQLKKREIMRMKHDPKNLDWKYTMRLLAHASATTNRTSGEKLVMKTRTIYGLTGTVGPNSWRHEIRDGCEIIVPIHKNPEDDGREVLLRGSSRAVELTREFLEEAERKQLDDPGSVALGEEDSPPILSVYSRQAAHFTDRTVPRADELPIPTQWTIRTFAEYIEALVSAKIPRTVLRELYPDEETHIRTVADVLLRTFSDPSAQAFVSARAVHDALLFTSRHFPLLRTCDSIFDMIRRLGLTLHIQTFNALYRAFLNQNDLDRLKSTFSYMQHVGVLPDTATWCALLHAVGLQSTRRRIFRYIRKVNVFPTTGDKMHLAFYDVDAHFAASVVSEGGFSSFVAYMDEHYQQNWLSPHCVNRMIDACGEQKLWDLIPPILELSQKRNDALGPRSLNHLLKSFRQRRTILCSIALLQSHFARTLGRDDAFAIPIVFMTAWHTRFHNVCRVLWRYAAARGIITYTMQNMVLSGLFRNHDTPGLPASHGWKTSASKIIVGVDLDIAELDPHFSLLKQGADSNHPMKWLARWTENDGTRTQQRQLAQVMLRRDLTAWKKFAPMTSEKFLALLSKAYTLDLHWKSYHKEASLSTDWMIDNAIEVPLIRQEMGFKERRAGNIHSSPRTTTRTTQNMAGEITSLSPRFVTSGARDRLSSVPRKVLSAEQREDVPTESKGTAEEAS